jgi:hypothetical protein
VVDDGQWNPAAAVAPGRYQRLKTLANKSEVWDHGADDRYKEGGPVGPAGHARPTCLVRACNRFEWGGGLVWSTVWTLLINSLG